VPERRTEAPQSETTRLETFCDGVFAIAITLLVLEIRVPDHAAVERSGGLWPALGALWPSYLAYALSFLIIGIMWANHHSLFTYIRRCDRYFLLINVGFLMLVAFLPFPTALVAEYLAVPSERRMAVAYYSATLTAIAIGFNAVWWYAAAGRRLLDPASDPVAVRTISRRYALGPVSYGLSVALAFVNVWASLAVHAGLAALYVLPERHTARHPRHEMG
jgi:uncharacterized membrane protein